MVEITERAFSQENFRCRFDWGHSGALRAAERGDIIVVVDTLSFSTAVVTAVHHGVVIFPCKWTENPLEIARKAGGEAAVKRREVPDRGRFSLSFLTYLDAAEGTRVVLPSPNGATCCDLGRSAPMLFAAAPVNAQAAGEAVSCILADSRLNVTVLACGERVPGNRDGSLRFAVEDLLGAGAVLSYIDHSKSAEALVAENAFLQSRGMLPDILRDCDSGQELIHMGYPDDISFAAQLNQYDTLPVLISENELIRFEKYV